MPSAVRVGRGAPGARGRGQAPTIRRGAGAVRERRAARGCARGRGHGAVGARLAYASAMQVPPLLIATSAVSVAFMVLFPWLVALLVRPRLGVGWGNFFAGMLVFTLVQTVTRVPAVQILQSAIGPQLSGSPALLWGWLAVLALTAGLFEEVGRYFGYRWLIREP